MKKIFSFLLYCIGAVAIMLLLSSCSKDEFVPYNTPFFNIHVDNRDTVMVNQNRKDEVEYIVNLSAELQYEAVQLQYEIKVGNGLQEGRDFNLKTKGSSLNFVPGMLQRGIKIEWLANPVDPAMDNKIIIKLTGNSKNFGMGVPGPDKRQQQLVIIKTS